MNSCLLELGTRLAAGHVVLGMLHAALADRPHAMRVR